MATYMATMFLVLPCLANHDGRCMNTPVVVDKEKHAAMPIILCLYRQFKLGRLVEWDTERVMNGHATCIHVVYKFQKISKINSKR